MRTAAEYQYSVSPIADEAQGEEGDVASTLLLALGSDRPCV